MNTKNSGRDKSRSRRTSDSKKSKGTSATFKPKKKEASPFSKGFKKEDPKAVKKSTPKTASKAVEGEEVKKEVSARDKRKYIDFKSKVKKGDPLPSFNEHEIRLNKYLSNAGICSRREADVLIETGVITINGEIVTELGL